MKTLNIDTCEDCCHHIFDDNEIPERWGKHWCTHAERECDSNKISAFCRLPDTKENKEEIK